MAWVKIGREKERLCGPACKTLCWWENWKFHNMLLWAETDHVQTADIAYKFFSVRARRF